MNWIIANYAFVLFFGVALSLSFADIGFRKHAMQYGVVFLLLGLIQVLVFSLFGEDVVYRLYPFLTHIPLFLIIKYYNKKTTYMSLIAILSAYLFCTPRKWIGTLVSFFWGYNAEVSFVVQILITIPLLIAIIKYISPFVTHLRFEDNKVLKYFVIVPAIYYGIAYSLTVYTGLLYAGDRVVVEFLDASMVIIYFIFSILYLRILYEKKEIEIEQALLRMMANQSKVELESLRQSQKQAAIYRHDLRHHLTYLNACLTENRVSEALTYIESVHRKIDATKITKYIENEPINLILSSYVNLAEGKQIPCEIHVTAADFDKYAIIDLCSLLSNALENAIQACEQIPDEGKRFIKLRLYHKNNKLCIDIRNSCGVQPEFDQGMPIALEQGHGYGTKSMAFVVEKYGGICQFAASEGEFTFQATI